MMTRTIVVTTLFAAVHIAGASPATLAQAPAGNSKARGAYDKNIPQAQVSPQGMAAAAAPDLIAPVFRITSIEVIRSTHPPVLDIIRVRGLASSSGWEEAELVPLTRGTPPNGMLDLIFVARAPSQAMEATGFEEVEAIFPLESEHRYRGVNVHGAYDSVSLGQFPGYAEGKPAGEDCRQCVGKVFVPRGAVAPAGKSAAEIVKEEQLPSTLRVIKHSDGISSAEANPNRLTIVLSKDGTISAAVWD